MQLNRKNFLKLAAWSFSVFFFGLTISIPTIKIRSRQKKIRLLLENINSGANLFDEVIIVKDLNMLRAYLRRCTHLGCPLNINSDGTLICPCHGSQFNLAGMAVTGPATKNLTELAIKIDPEKKFAEVEYELL